MKDLAKYLDLANHHANATQADIRLVCEKVKKYGFNAAFVNPFYAEQAKSFGVKVGTVISFPLGQEVLKIKLTSARAALADGVDELDVALNTGYIKEAKWEEAMSEMKVIVAAVREISGAKIIKFIAEAGYLTESEFKKLAEVVGNSGADFLKICSGMGPRGPEVSDVVLAREVLGNKLKIKVAGGIETYDQAMKFIEAGVDRIGTSHAVEIVTGQPVARGIGE